MHRTNPIAIANTSPWYNQLIAIAIHTIANYNTAVLVMDCCPGTHSLYMHVLHYPFTVALPGLADWSAFLEQVLQTL